MKKEKRHKELLECKKSYRGVCRKDGCFHSKIKIEVKLHAHEEKIVDFFTKFTFLCVTRYRSDIDFYIKLNKCSYIKYKWYNCLSFFIDIVQSKFQFLSAHNNLHISSLLCLPSRSTWKPFSSFSLL
jgi:hypothetical protein